jgi:hypothetical protein
LNLEMTTLTAFYDLTFGPVSFDAVTWLVRARLMADRAQCRRLHCVIVPKEDGIGGFARHWGEHDEHASRWRLWHIVLPAMALAGATVTLADSREQARALQRGPYWWPEGKAHFAGPLVQAAREGGRIPVLTASVQARRYVAATLAKLNPAGRPLVTLTKRRQDTHADRNTQPAEWAQFASWLWGAGYAVIQLDDSHIALQDGQGYFELDVDLRLALYEQAGMNVIGNNGPGELLRHSTAPYLQVGVGLGEWKAHYEKHLGLKTGDQLPWARPDQRMVYRPDEVAVMRDEFIAAMEVQGSRRKVQGTV